jgi:hypothetical protein
MDEVLNMDISEPDQHLRCHFPDILKEKEGKGK